MSIVDKIKSLDMEVDKKYGQGSLIEALEIYHSLVEKNIIRPRENQLNRSGMAPQIIHFNSN